MTDRSYRGWFWTLALLGLLLDQTSKYGVFHWLYDGSFESAYSVVPGAFRLSTHYTPTGEPYVNSGALFGLGGEKETMAHRFFTWLGQTLSGQSGPLNGATTSNGFFAVVSLLAALAIIIWSTRKTAAQDRLLCIALGLILGGTLGNLYDRLVFKGVRDFLHYFYLIEWPVFNVADCCLVCGAFLLLAQAFWTQPVAVTQTEADYKPGA